MFGALCFLSVLCLYALFAVLHRHNMKTGKCAACDQPTQGIFNIATDILKKMKQAKPS